MRTGKGKKHTKGIRQSTKSLRPQSPRTSSGLHVVFRKGIVGTDGILFDGKPQVAFVGRSNVGKSSTINAILGAGVARVSARPGKTQEINFFEINDRSYVVDLPGYGYAKMNEAMRDKIRKHIVWYLTGGEAKPRLLVLVIDATVGLTPLDEELVAIAKEVGHPILVLANKIDKFGGNDRRRAVPQLQSKYPELEMIAFSASKKVNLSEVRRRVLGALGCS